MGLRIIGGFPFGSLLLMEKDGIAPSVPSFSPLDLSPHIWWGDSGTDASTWEDLSGNGINAVQADSARRPAIVTGQNGRQVRRFDGVNDVFQFSAPTQAQPYEIWMAYVSSFGNNFAVAFNIGGSVSLIGYDFRVGDGFDSFYAAGGFPVPYFEGSEAFQILRLVFDGASSFVERNGSNLSLSGAVPGDGGLSGTGYLGANSLIDAFSAFDVGEFFILPLLDPDQSAALLSYLMAKWSP